MTPIDSPEHQEIGVRLHPVRVVNEADLETGAETPPVAARDGLLPCHFHEAIWYVTGTRETETPGGSGIAMCNVLFYHWDPLAHIWIEAGPQRPVVNGGILSQRTYGERVAIRLKDVRGSWSIKVKAA